MPKYIGDLTDAISSHFQDERLYCSIPVAVIRTGMRDKHVIHPGHRGYRELEWMTGEEWFRMAKPWLIRLLSERDSWGAVDVGGDDSDSDRDSETSASA